MPKCLSNPVRQGAHRVVAIAYDRLCTFEYSIAAEIFGSSVRPHSGWWYEFKVAAGEVGPLHAHGGLAIIADGGLDLLKDAETVVVPGWRNPTEAAPQALLQAIRAAHANGSRIASICGGAFLVAEAGLLSGRRATTHWDYASIFARKYPDVQFEPDVLYVDEGDILTSAGSAAGIDLCLHIVKQDYGSEVANSVARSLVISPFRNGSQSQHIERPIPRNAAARLSPLLDWIRASLTEELHLSHLSAKAAMSPRTLHRRFVETVGTTPAEWILSERITQACFLLETTRMGVDEIAHLSGLGSSATMQYHFRRRLHASPTSYRSQSGKTGRKM